MKKINLSSITPLVSVGMFFITMTSANVTGCKSPTSSITPPPTVDTTSHNFTFTFDTLGDGNNSRFSDVWMVNENDIWAVGRIWKDDSSWIAYGGAHWDGSKWDLVRFKAKFTSGDTLYPTPIGVIAFGPNDVWMSGGDVFHYDGQNTKAYWIRKDIGTPNGILDSNQYIRKLWGTSGSNLWAVGTSGAIAYFNGSVWKKIESGTTLDITDVWGAYNSKTGKTQVLAVASNSSTNNREIYELTETTAIKISSSPIQWPLSSLWFTPNKQYYVAGSGIYQKISLSEEKWKELQDITPYYSTCIRGNDINDVFVCGAYGDVLHYNGSTWKSFFDQTSINGSYGSLAIKGNKVILVGVLDNSSCAFIATGIRK